MAQARLKSPRRTQQQFKKRLRDSLPALGLLTCGIIIGTLATMLWQGAGIRQMFAGADQPKVNMLTKPAEPSSKSSTDFTFFTVLPEIEVVVPPQPKPTINDAATPPNNAKTDNARSLYMLQAGSYRIRPEAESMKASLALKGFVSNIQKVSIQDKGDFYRVRVGPYSSYREMEQADKQLRENGIKTLQLKMFKAN